MSKRKYLWETSVLRYTQGTDLVSGGLKILPNPSKDSH